MIVFVEPFHGGSHAPLLAFVEGLARSRGVRFEAVTLPPKKWHWRLAAGSMWAADAVPPLPPGSILFASGLLNLAELRAMRRDIAAARTVYFMHENQLAYPVRGGGGGGGGGAAAGKADVRGVDVRAAGVAAGEGSTRGFAAGWAQLVSMLSADVVAWNSSWNLDSFAANIVSLLRAIPCAAQRPDARKVIADIYARSVVTSLPVAPLPQLPPLLSAVGAAAPGGVPDSAGPLIVAWPHRWEYDKGPLVFFEALLAQGVTCQVILLGEEGVAVSDSDFSRARDALGARVRHWGFARSRDAYADLLRTADVVVSTAYHEFFGVGMLEGVFAGAFPLAPVGLAYEEVFTPDVREAARVEHSEKRARALIDGASRVADDGDLYALPMHAKVFGQGAGSAGGTPYAPAPRPPRDSAFYYDGTADGLANALRKLGGCVTELRAWRAQLSVALAAQLEVCPVGNDAGLTESNSTAAEGGAGATGGGGKRARTETAHQFLSATSAVELAESVSRFLPIRREGVFKQLLV